MRRRHELRLAKNLLKQGGLLPLADLAERA